MKYINIGKYITASQISFECSAFSGKDMSANINTLGRCIESGINYFNHNDHYTSNGSTSSFKYILKSLSVPRDSYHVQLTSGMMMGANKLAKELLVSEVERSLSELGGDYIDVLLFHAPYSSSKYPLEADLEQLELAFDTLERSGKVRNFGLSAHSYEQMKKFDEFSGRRLVLLRPRNILHYNDTPNCFLIHSRSSEPFGEYCDYSRINNTVIQERPEFYYPNANVTFGSVDKNTALERSAYVKELAEKYETVENAVVAAWWMSHPAQLQLVCDRCDSGYIDLLCKADQIGLSDKEWQKIFELSYGCLS